jgi:hypothetical protein
MLEMPSEMAIPTSAPISIDLLLPGKSHGGKPENCHGSAHLMVPEAALSGPGISDVTLIPETHPNYLNHRLEPMPNSCRTCLDTTEKRYGKEVEMI